MRWTAEGGRQATCIFEAAAWHRAVRPVCRCGHASAFNPHGLWAHFEKRGWDDSFAQARARFWCRVCGVRTRRKVTPVRIEAVAMTQGDVRLPMPDERDWKRALSRFRS